MSVLTDALYTTLRLIARHVSGFFGALAAFLTVGFIVAAGAVAIFGLIANAVSQGATQAFDEAVLRWLAQYRTPGLDDAMLEITALGAGLVLILVAAVACIFLWLSQHRWSVYALLLGLLGAKLLNTLLKGFFARERPSAVTWLTDVSSKSFPSGHAMSSIVVYGSIAYLIARLEPNRALRRTIWIVAALLVGAIGVSRMYLGVHYPSDVIGGFIAGLAWVLFVAATLSAVRFFADRRPETHAEEEDLHR